MYYSKLRHASSNSIIDISSNHSTNLSYSGLSKFSYNQNRIQSESRNFSHHQLCHSYSKDSLDKEFIENTKETFNKLFHQTNFNELLNQIQNTLQPIINQLRQKIQEKKYLSKQERFICIKSCAKFIIESLLNEQWNIDEDFIELYQLQQILDRFLLKQRIDISTQTNEQLETDMMSLHINDHLKKKSLSKVSFVSTDDRQKHIHRSVSRTFRKLHTDLQKMNHEIPFKSHLSKYHKHNH